jgi:hypothetical protein
MQIVKYGALYESASDRCRAGRTRNDSYYQITPVGLGKIASLRDKLELLIGNIIVQLPDQQGLQLHPMGKYLLEREIRLEAINRHKKTEYEMAVIEEWTKSQEGDEVIKDFVMQVLASIVGKEKPGSDRVAMLKHYEDRMR